MILDVDAELEVHGMECWETHDVLHEKAWSRRASESGAESMLSEYCVADRQSKGSLHALKSGSSASQVLQEFSGKASTKKVAKKTAKKRSTKKSFLARLFRL